MDIRRRRHHCHPIAAPPSPLPSLRRHRHRCAATFSAIAAPHRCAPSCAAIAALPPQSLRSHRLRRRCATTTSTPVSRAPVNDASASRRSPMIPTQQSKVMNRKARVVVERERGEDNDGDDDFDNDDIGKAEAVVKTTMTTTSDAHVGGGTIDTTIKKCGQRSRR